MSKNYMTILAMIYLFQGLHSIKSAFRNNLKTKTYYLKSQQKYVDISETQHLK